MRIFRPLVRQALRPAGVIALLASLGGMPAMAETVDLPVVVRLAEGASLPPEALLEVELLDVSRADAPAEVLSSHRYRIEVLPAIVKLPYDDAQIDDRMSYVVAGKVREGETVVLRTTTAFPAITRDAPARPEIVLEQMASAPVADMPRITGIEWAAFEIGGRMLVTEDPPSMAFNDDGGFSMYGGCNRFSGRAEIGDGTLTIVQPLAGTRRACPEPRMKLDQDMVAALEQATGYVRNGKNLSLTNASGVTVLRLTERPE
ncbi:META domain-containing protein [Salipiger pacificus]|nr:META domain-containing protein [Alloyangia pacifica]MCA0944790.1 META domain-containing protein [Alloyangia pacifica]